MPNNTTTMTHIEQQRAKFAYECAKQGQNMIEKAKHGQAHQIETEWFQDKKYTAYVEQFPMHVKTNGLGAALAFVLSKRKKQDEKKSSARLGNDKNPKNAYDLLYQQITAWVVQQQLISGFTADKDLVSEVIQQNSREYRVLTIQILSVFTWWKRFTNGLIKED